MAKKESSFINMVLTLMVVTVVASFALGSVYNITKEPIAQSKLKKKQTAIGLVVPEFDELKTETVMPLDGKDPLEFNYAYKNGELVGVAVETYTDNGFSGRIKAMVGFTPEGVIVDVVHLEHKETPGLGDKIEKGKNNWSDLFRNFDPSVKTLKVKKDGGDVDAITAATITSRAYCDAIERAYQTFKKQGGKE